MKRVVTVLAVLFAVVVPSLMADYTVENRGAWPETWPKELDALRDQARTLEGPLRPALHYAITFKSRDDFEAAWPHLLKVKSQGAPIVLRRGANFFLGGGEAGVCIHTPPEGTEPQSGADVDLSKLQNTIYIELIVDGEIVDLNRIALPGNTPIVDERFPEGGN